MILITEQFGKLGNRLLRYARTLALAEMLNCRLLDLSLFEYASLFAPLDPYERASFGALRYLAGQRRFEFLARWLARRPGFLHLSEYSRETGRDHHEGIAIGPLAERLRGGRDRHLLCDRHGYYLKADTLLPLLPKLRRIFRFASVYEFQASKLLGELVPPGATLVGVHIRAGDYRTFGDGIFYYDNAAYARAMRDTLAHPMFRGKQVRFVLISDEAITIDPDFTDLPVLYYGQQSIAVDMALLAACQFLIATNSTFSGWVSFLEQIPRFILARDARPPAWETITPADATVFV